MNTNSNFLTSDCWVPFSLIQQGVWVHQVAVGFDSPLYTEGGVTEIHGTVDVSLMREAIRLSIRRHAQLGAIVREIDPQPVFEYGHSDIVPIEVLDFSQEQNPQEYLKEWGTKQIRTPFNPFYERPLVSFAIIRLAAEHFAIMHRYHQIIADAWGVAYHISEMIRCYDSLLTGEREKLTEPVPYREYYELEKSYLKSERYQKDIAFWDEYLAVPASRVFQSSTGTSGKSWEVYEYEESIPYDFYTRFQERAQQVESTSTSALLALVYVLIGRLYGEEDFIIHTPSLNRRDRRQREIVGSMVNIVFLRANWGMRGNLAELARSVAIANRKVIRHSACPSLQVASLLHNRGVNASEMMDILFNHPLVFTPPNSSFNSTLTHHYSNQSAIQALAITFSEYKKGDDPTLRFYCGRRFFKEGEARLLFRRLVLLMQSFIENPYQAVAELDLILPEEKIQIEKWSQGNKQPAWITKRIDRLVEEVVQNNPDQIALSGEGGQWTYRELSERSNRLANKILERGAKGENIAVLAYRSHRLPVVVLGIFKAGAIYVPIDDSLPAERIHYLIQDSDAKLVIILDPTKADKLPLSVEYISFDDMMKAEPGFPSVPLDIDDPAYIIYTSGTTGRPKGSIISHRGLVNAVLAQSTVLEVTEQDRGLFFSSPSFDASMMEMFVPLVKGATLHSVPFDTILNRSLLLETIEKERITFTFFPPSFLQLFERRPLRNMRALFVGGEASIPEDARFYASQLHYVNVYGPTECSICATLKLIKPDDERILLGRPIPNTEAYVLDRFQRPLPPGYQGELYLGGVGLGIEYFKQPELTQQRFITASFDPNKRLYRTGDLVRWTEEGELEYLGRIDNQVKLNGYRIELGEIENMLMEQSGIQKAVVLMIQEETGAKHLVAFVVPDTAIEFHESEIRERLARFLPYYMMPSQIIPISSVPLTLTLKVDRRALEAIAVQQKQAVVETKQKTSSLLDEVTDVWRKYFSDRLNGTQSNFFTMGGDSLTGVRLCADLSDRFGIDISLRILFEHPNLTDFASRIEIALQKQSNSAE